MIVIAKETCPKETPEVLIRSSPSRADRHRPQRETPGPRPDRHPRSGRGKRTTPRGGVTFLAGVLGLALFAGCSADPRDRAEGSGIAAERREGITRSAMVLSPFEEVGTVVATRRSDWCDAGRRDSLWDPGRLLCNVERRLLIDPADDDLPGAAAAMRAALSARGCAGVPLDDAQLARDVAAGGVGVFSSSGCFGVTVTVRWYSDPEAASRLNASRPFPDTGFWLREGGFDDSELGSVSVSKPFVWWVDADYTYVNEQV